MKLQRGAYFLTGEEWRRACWSANDPTRIEARDYSAGSVHERQPSDSRTGLRIINLAG